MQRREAALRVDELVQLVLAIDTRPALPAPAGDVASFLRIRRAGCAGRAGPGRGRSGAAARARGLIPAAVLSGRRRRRTRLRVAEQDAAERIAIQVVQLDDLRRRLEIGAARR